MKLVVLEGCDNTGKSTVATKLKAELELQGLRTHITHWGKPEAKNQKENYLWWIAQTAGDLSSDSDVVIWDRSFIGNHIYGTLYGDQPTLTFNEMMELLNYLYNNHVWEIQIHLLQADYETLKLRFVSEKEAYVPTEDITYLQHKYKILLEYVQAIKDFMPWPKAEVIIHKENEPINSIILNISSTL